MQSWPLLDIRDALANVAGTLEDLCREVAMLQSDSDGQYPPEAEVFTANVQALRELLGTVMPATFREAVDADGSIEDAEYLTVEQFEEEGVRWGRGVMPWAR